MLIVTCECGQAITPINVTKYAPIRRAAGYVAVTWRCPMCKRDGRNAILETEWTPMEAELSNLRRRERNTLIAAQIELDYIDDAGDLLALWASYPGAPPRELPSARGCGCPQCKARDIGKA